MAKDPIDELVEWLNEAVTRPFFVGAGWGGIESLESDRALRIRLRRRDNEEYLNVSLIKIGEFPTLTDRIVVHLRLENGLLLDLDGLHPSSTNKREYWAKLEYVLHATALKLEFVLD